MPQGGEGGGKGLRSSEQLILRCEDCDEEGGVVGTGGGGGAKGLRSSEQLILSCEDCDEKLVVFGTEEDWRSRHAVFVCGYGHKLTLDGRADKEVIAAS